VEEEEEGEEEVEDTYNESSYRGEGDLFLLQCRDSRREAHKSITPVISASVTARRMCLWCASSSSLMYGLASRL